MNSMGILRMFFGGLFISFVPGFAWSYIFFARKNIDWLERVTLSFELSIALVSISIFWLNWLFHIEITLLSTCIMVSVITGLAVVCIFSKRYLHDRFATSRLRLILGRGNGKQGNNPFP